MLLSKYFLPITKEVPAEATILSHQLMLRSGMIKRTSAGIYSWLPLGLKVLKKVEKIIRREMDKGGLVEMLMPFVQDGELWAQSGRIDTYGQEMLKFKDRHDHQLLFGPTAEELITNLVKGNLQSYKNLPKILYQIQWKFRDEIRPRFGVMRGREFLMKDAYSFDIDAEAATKTYYHIFQVYMNCFAALNLKVLPLQADTGEIGGELSHEFHVVADTGESTLYYDKQYEQIATAGGQIDIEALQKIYAVTEEKYEPDACPISAENLSISKGIEVGHIFNFGDKYSKLLALSVNDAHGCSVPIQMGSYGIGVTRLVGALIEVNHDQNGIIWPENTAPFDVVVINLNSKNAACNHLTTEIYGKLIESNVDVLCDDTNQSIGAKLATQDLIGIPWQIIVGPKNAANQQVELKCRKTGDSKILSAEQIYNKFINNSG